MFFTWNKMKSVFRVVGLWLIALTAVFFLMKCHSEEKPGHWDINQGYVPDSATAVQIAQIIFVRVFGEKVLEKKPFRAVLKRGIWVVDGSLDNGMDGGVPHIAIQKSDGKILDLYHSK